jgi:glycosyltransferase involved in cell wall biosynthesis
MEKTVLITYHYSPLEGPINYYIKYLISNRNTVYSLAHPLDNYSNKQTFLNINNKRAWAVKRANIGLLNLIIDMFISIKVIFDRRFQTYVGANNFDVLAAVISRILHLKKINKIIYFASDFSEKRYKNSFLNEIYYLIEKIVLANSDLIISNTTRSEQKRIEMGLNKSKSLVIPNIIYADKFNLKKKKIQKNRFIYVGGISKEHGLFNMINIIYPLIAELIIIGYGNEWNKVKTFLLREKINFKFYNKKNHQFVMDYLKKFDGFGLAPYNLDEKWVYYCSPLKINEYIACGVPVITSDVVEISNYLKINDLGIVYKQLNCKYIKEKLFKFNFKRFEQKAEEFIYNYGYKNNYSKIPIFL